jgi:hypothetical protein
MCVANSWLPLARAERALMPSAHLKANCTMHLLVAPGQANTSATVRTRTVVYGSAVGRMISPDGYLPSESCFLRGGVSQNATSCALGTAFTTWVLDRNAGTWSEHAGVNCYPNDVRVCHVFIFHMTCAVRSNCCMRVDD